MNTPDALYFLKQMKRQYRAFRTVESLLWALAGAFVFLSVGVLVSFNSNGLVLLAGIAGITGFVIRSVQLGIFSVNDARLASFINQHYPPLEESADLLLKDEAELSSLQQLQKRLVLERFEQIRPTIKLPHKLAHASITLMVTLVVYIGLSSFAVRKEIPEVFQANEFGKVRLETRLPASIEKAIIKITPPGYTNLPGITGSDFDIALPEGSLVHWTIRFSEKVDRAIFQFSGNDSVPLIEKGNKEFAATRQFTRPGFYQVGWNDQTGKRKYSDYYKIEVIRDHAPSIAVENPDQLVVLTSTDKLNVEVRAVISDDYGLTDAYVIATVSKGSGESVKFREAKLLFSVPEKISGKKLTALRSIDLKKLGLDPGDELYFYIEAVDNKAPVSNHSRTETFFIALQDTAFVSSFSDSGLGVDLMPEYFRSQRQIIIDSEKLLSEKRKITLQEFNARSNALGHDQKVLRLRYGQFLGEEFESGIGIQQEFSEEDNDHDDEEDVTKKYGHVHDKENEHNQVEVKRPATQHAHAHDEEDPDKKEDPMDAFLHAHDSEEEATFFVQSIKIKLKAAITVMWDAELHLRLYDPVKSLPYQYKALNLLKEISQDSRIYVHRVGFDPPPLKEEKRLTGDLSELRSIRAQYVVLKKENFPAIREAVTLLAAVHNSLSPAVKSALIKAGQELAVVALNDPKYIGSLSLLKALQENELAENEKEVLIEKILRTFWEVLPLEQKSPTARPVTLHPLDREFIKNLEVLKNQ